MIRYPINQMMNPFENIIRRQALQRWRTRAMLNRMKENDFLECRANDMQKLKLSLVKKDNDSDSLDEENDEEEFNKAVEFILPPLIGYKDEEFSSEYETDTDEEEELNVPKTYAAKSL